MKRYKILKLICPVLALLLLTSCTSIKNIVFNIAENASETVGEYAEKNGYNNPHKYAVSTFNEVLELIQAKNSQAIFDMFNEDARANVDLMFQIEDLVEFMNGEITEIGHIGASNAYSSVRDGITVSSAYTATADVTNNNGVLYWVKVNVITADEDETKLGLDWIYILDCNVKTVYSTKWENWNERRINGAKEPEPERPENMEVGVHYFKSQE